MKPMYEKLRVRRFSTHIESVVGNDFRTWLSLRLQSRSVGSVWLAIVRRVEEYQYE